VRKGRPILGDSRNFGWQLSHNLNLPCISNLLCNNNNTVDKKKKKSGFFIREKSKQTQQRKKTNYQSIRVISENLGLLIKRSLSKGIVTPSK
jgi:hypothetical protein